MADDAGFLQRWAQRKAQVRQGLALDEAVAAPVPVPVPPAVAVVQPAVTAEIDPAPEPAAPTLDDVARLAPDSPDFSRFMAPKVPSDVRNAAMKKLFTDPHFNVMDGLDVYIDDYSQPDPLPAAWLKSMVQSQLLGLLSEAPEPAAPAPPAAPDNPPA